MKTTKMNNMGTNVNYPTTRKEALERITEEMILGAIKANTDVDDEDPSDVYGRTLTDIAEEVGGLCYADKVPVTCRESKWHGGGKYQTTWSVERYRASFRTRIAPIITKLVKAGKVVVTTEARESSKVRYAVLTKEQKAAKAAVEKANREVLQTVRGIVRASKLHDCDVYNDEVRMTPSDLLKLINYVRTNRA